MRDPVFTGYIRHDNKKFFFNAGQKQKMEKYIMSLNKSSSDDVDAYMMVKIVKQKRSVQHNNLYYLRRDILSRHTGMHPDDLHSYCLERCGFGEYKDVGGKTRFSRASSADLSTQEFSSLVRVQQDIANELNLGLDKDRHLILPGEDDFERR